MYPFPPRGPQSGRTPHANVPPGQRFAPPGGMRSMPGLGGAARSPLNMLTMVENVQKMLQVAETMGPMVKQYGPMVKNLPDMMKSLKEFRDTTNKAFKEKKEAREEAKAQKEATVQVQPEPRTKKKEKPAAQTKKTTKPQQKSQSKTPAQIPVNSEWLDESSFPYDLPVNGESSSFPYDIPEGTPEDAKIIIGPAAAPKVKNIQAPPKALKKGPVKKLQPAPKLFI
ncbi:VrrA/YqfQ family protein [Fictibacillus fluitans]|uniref:VrrA/YqfQ family protein n=1 Tax=Fictibacillus fluitans TaxID=3058422 RepID=A0ABT8HXA9_9BACL|nr:VrrA/YqfQ family protein [Fictibacillus sp. NE201]MDN4525416.1 VrrA/YqfQ family protein [Fictibacillus sp. NE201]